MKTITPELLREIAFGGAASLAAALAPELDAQLVPAGIDTPLRGAHFLAQACYESANFCKLEENLNYSPPMIAEVFGHAHPDIGKRAMSLGYNPQALGNAIYANRFGNGDEASGDGYKYRGRGLFQHTFRANYAELGFEDDPGSVATAAGAVKCAIAYWLSRKCNAAADADDCPAVTKLIQGGVGGFDVRRILTHRALPLLTEVN